MRTVKQAYANNASVRGGIFVFNLHFVINMSTYGAKYVPNPNK